LLSRLTSALVLAAIAWARPAVAEPLKFTPSKDDNFTESVTFIADLEGGTYVLAQMSLTNIGPGAENAVCRVLIASTGVATQHLNERFGSGDWSYTTGPKSVLRVGTCSVEATARDTTLRASVKGATLTLAYAAPPTERTPPNNVISVGARQHVTTILHSATPVTATIKLPKGATVNAPGVGYADHSRSEVKPSALAKRWIRFRGLTGQQKELLLGREALDGSFGPLWTWQLPGDPLKLAKFAVTKKGERTKPSFEIEATGLDNQRLKIRSKSFLYRHAPVEDLGFLGKVVQPVVGSPVTYTTRATLDLPDGRSVDGILEVSVDAE
jgi:hypothetical protein